MITVRFLKNNRGFKISGHSGYGEPGKDIVCSAVSSAAYLTVNTLTEAAGKRAAVEVEDKSGCMKMLLHDTDGVTDIIMNGFKLHMCQLAESFPEYVIIRK